MIKRLEIKLSSGEHALLESMATNKSVFIRMLILDEAARRGLALPADTLKDTRGKYPRKN